jgi:two-component system chemotaxis sensor kinase CheA
VPQSEQTESSKPDAKVETAPSSSSAVSDGNVRVDVELLDKLMNLVGELVLARNQILQYGVGNEELAFVGASQRLNLITTELQEQVMRTRMQPIGNVWAKLPRVVRDLAITCGKQVRVEMVGKNTELDRTIIEAIKDPLTHIVRNAVDHGVEMPDVRAAAGKPRTGTLTLRAYHGGGQVNIEIHDDGAGVNLDRIRAKAAERNLVAAERLEGMSEYELMQLVFLPGFSTAAQVTNVSGRGVGMDVVKTNIERIGGSVDLSSRPGGGTTLKIRIPLTLAIVPALVVVSANERYAIPQSNLLELVRLAGEDARNGVEMVFGAPVLRLRGQLLPLVYLSQALGLAGDSNASPASQEASRIVNIVVLQANEGQVGLVVDEVRDTEEIVVKPLGKELKGIQVFAGATIMGDGRVALILDVVGLAQHVGVASRSRDRNAAHHVAAKATAGAAGEDQRQTLLLFRTRDNATMAIPLALVARIEEFPRERLERAGGNNVVQYRSEVLPLIDLSDRLTNPGGDTESPLMPIIVYSEGNRSVGFIVDGILDVVEESVVLETCTSHGGILGSVVVQGKVTDMLDVQGVIRAQAPWFYEGAAA